MSNDNDDDDDEELSSAEELREEAARPGIDCLVARWALAIAVEVIAAAAIGQ